jgi:hypothetical protein
MTFTALWTFEGSKHPNPVKSIEELNMPASLKREGDNIYFLRITGNLTKSDLGAAQDIAGDEIDHGAKPRLLVTLENFEGFERGASWGELEFLSTHINDIAKIAIVGDPKWESDAVAFAGAGSRQAPVKFFPAAKLSEARAWLI